MEILGADIVPYISEPDFSMLLLEVTSADFKQIPESEMEEGEAHVKVVEVFHSDVVKQGQEIILPFERVADEQARIMQGFNAWNTLAFAPGDLLIMACTPLDPPERWQGVAVQEVDSMDAPEIADVRRCYEAESHSDRPQRFQIEIQKALASPDELYRYYGVDALTRRAMFDRQTSVKMIAEALRGPDVSSEAREELTGALADNFFEEDLGNEPVNVEILSSILGAIIAEPDDDQQRELILTLASLVFSGFSEDENEDEQTQIALVQAVRQPSMDQVITVLERQAQQGEEDEREVFNELLDLWKAASRK